MRWSLWLIAVLCAVLIATACGGGDDGIPNYGESGPFDVGVTFLTLPGDRPVDVWYPVEGGQTSDKFTHNLNDPWPESILSKVPQVPDSVVDAYPEAQASDAGPFPVILESHGFGSSRRDGALNHRHLASWGFVVIAPEHFERNRATVTGQPVEFEVMDSVDVLLAALALVEEASLTEGSVLEGSVDSGLIAVDGVSAGGRAALDLGNDPRIGAVVARAPAGSGTPDSGVPVLLLASDRDVAVDVDGVRTMFDEMASPKSLAVILDGGHNTFTDACAVIREAGGLDIEAFVEATGFPAELLEFGNNGCTEEYVDPTAVWPAINHLQVAHIRWALGIDTSDEALTADYIEETYGALLAEYVLG